MSRETQAEVFIRTLAQMVNDKREGDFARLRLHHKAHAERYMKAFRTEPVVGLLPAAWATQGRSAGNNTVVRIRND